MSHAVPVAVPTILLPKASVDPRRWAVIACDQFTSEPEYWREVQAVVGDAPSTLRMILPELFLTAPDVAERIALAQQAMRDYLAAGILDEHQAMVYVERSVSSGIQQGLVVALDLEAYDYTAGSTALVRSTEGTVLDRLPPRMKVRRGAPLESPHILVLYDDPEWVVLRDVLEHRDELPVAYDFDTMLNSGHLSGRLITDLELQQSVVDGLASLITAEEYERKYGLGDASPLLFAMGDGNHSLATAKAIWEEMKAAGASLDHPARYALVELVNLHDASLIFEPIHRVVFDCPTLPEDLRAAFAAARMTPVADLDALDAMVREDVSPAQRFGMVTADGYTLVEIPAPEHALAVGTLQDFLDAWLNAHPVAEIDYVHGEEALDRLARQEANCGFVLPAIAKDSFFRSIAVDGSFPRKTFSLGHAADKRFYQECRQIG